uniref:Uncharacterized protein n=1 Tax=Tolypothrix bouteillei VB521301 TaxID=1479485 RepID=A0A0C1RP08_9CYAN
MNQFYIESVKTTSLLNSYFTKGSRFSNSINWSQFRNLAIQQSSNPGNQKYAFSHIHIKTLVTIFAFKFFMVKVRLETEIGLP